MRYETVSVIVDTVYGKQVYRPNNLQARVFAEIAGTKTLTKSVLDKIVNLGFKIETCTMSID